jgi:hypothetical protein
MDVPDKTVQLSETFDAAAKESCEMGGCVVIATATVVVSGVVVVVVVVVVGGGGGVGVVSGGVGRMEYRLHRIQSSALITFLLQPCYR